MAEATEVLLLLLALISTTVQDEFIQRAGGSHHFILNKTADFCLISRWTGEEKTLLWNSSECHNPSVDRAASYWLSSLSVSDSGRYQEQCWTQGNVTHERNSTLVVCDRQNMADRRFHPDAGDSLELSCFGAGPNQSVQWFTEYKNYKSGNWTFAPIVDGTSSVDELKLVKNKSSLLLTVSRHLGVIFYYCVEKNRQMCDLMWRFIVHVPLVYIHRAVGESLEMNCSDISDNQPPTWEMTNSGLDDVKVSLNNTLMFKSLTLDHSGRYRCKFSDLDDKTYELFVCPESHPPAAVFFTGGEKVTLHCVEWYQFETLWFMRSNSTEGRVLYVRNYRQKNKNKIYSTGLSLVIPNVSLEDSGEFWCVIFEGGHCVYRSKTLLMFGEPEVDHYLVRTVLLSVAIVLLCVAVVTVTIRRGRGRQHLPVAVEDVDMPELG